MLLLEGPPYPIYALTFSPDGRSLAVGAKEGSAWLWDDFGTKWEFDDAFRGFDAGVTSIAYSPNGESIAMAGPTGWHGAANGALAGPRTFGPIGRITTGVTAVRFLTDGLLAVGTGHRAKPTPGSFELWDLAKDRRREPRFPATNGVRAVAVQPGGGLVAWSEWSGATSIGPRLTVWDLRRPDPLRLSLTHYAVSIAFHPDGETLAATCEYGVRIFDLARRQEKLALKGHSGTATTVEFSPDGRTLASGSWDGTVRFWDPIAGHETACFRCPVGKVTALAYSPDGLRLAAGGDKGHVAMWDLD